jgi:eukaryotic-like serine/threonine-protein kinase
MPPDLAEQLQTSLGSSYTIVRELGGGGMSRVFLAGDNALGRSVVIKVLHPELAAGVNAERFKREVQLSARLQHPHVVPVLSAGEVDGLPYYVMPFVKGESLRARLASGPLPVPETISILADVAKALAYAQAEGVVHRDIKPDNILLSGGAATVADFGIAKAISSARQDTTDALTSLGTSLGTPAYMAPEQVAGDPNVDHRADIYSFGCVAYEMLTGQAPFAGKTPQQTLAAHVMESPVQLAERRAGLPPSLVAAVNRCLEKEPENRPQSAADLVSELEATGTHEIAPPRAGAKRRVPAWAVGALVVASAAAAIPAYRAMRPSVTPVDNGVLSVAVAPFDVLDPQVALWKEGMVDVLSRNLDGSGPIRSVPPSASVKRWEGHADRTVAAAFGKRVGAQIVVYGQLQPSGRDLVNVNAWVLDTRSDAAPIEVQFRDSIARMDRVTDSVSVKVLAAIGRNHAIGTARLASLGSGSIPAIKAFLQGSQYFRRTRWDSAAVAFREAVSLDSTFGVAYLHLAQSLAWANGGDPEANRAYKKAGELVRPGMSPRDSLLLTAVGHYASVGRNGARNIAARRAAISTMEAATQQYANDPEAWYLLGDMRLHSDPTVGYRDVQRYFDRSIQADSDFAVAYVHAIALAYRYGTGEGRRYAQAYLRRNPMDFEGEGIRFAERASDPKVSAAELQSLLDTLPPRVVQKAYAALQRLPDTPEMSIRILRTGVKRAPNPGAAISLTNALAGQLALRGHIDEAWSIAVANKNYLAAEIAGLGLIPTDSAAKIVRPWVNERNDALFAAMAVLAMAGDTTSFLATVPTIERIAALDTSPNAPVAKYVLSAMRAYTALARHDTAQATQLFVNLPDSVVTIPFDLFVRARLVGRRDPKRAIELLERYSASADLLTAARELERGRLAEKIGDHERAVDAFSYVAAIWAKAEPKQLKDAVKEANDALKRLDSDGRLRAQLGGPTKP